MQFHRHELLRRLGRVFLRIKRCHASSFDREANRSPAVSALIDELGVGLLNVRTVLQHLCAEIDCGRRRVDRPAIALFCEKRQVAAVVDVRMREDDSVQLRRRQRQMGIDFARLLPVSLKHAAVEQYVFSSRFDMMRRTGDGLRRTPELQSNGHRQKYTRTYPVVTCSKSVEREFHALLADYRSPLSSPFCVWHRPRTMTHARRSLL